MRWMNLEPIIQSEDRQKEKNKYRILKHIYGIQKDGTDEIILRGSNGDTQRTDLMTQGRGRKERVGCMERVPWKLILPYVKQIANGNLLYDSGNSNQGSVTTQRVGKGWEMGRRFKKKGTCVYLWLIHVVWLKPVQFCKTIILQLKNKFKQEIIA